MPVNGYTVGRDVVLDLITSRGPLRFSVRTGFSAKPEYNDIKVKRADGLTDHVTIPDGWGGTIDYERTNSAIDDYFAQVEEDYFSGLDVQSITITETITEKAGSISQWRYEGVVLKYSDPGSKGGDTTVKQKIDWMASRRKKVA